MVTVKDTALRRPAPPQTEPLPRPIWSRALPRPIVVSNVVILETLADARKLIRNHLTEKTRHKPLWRALAAQLYAAAVDGNTVDAALLLQMVLTSEGLDRLPKQRPV